MKNKYISFLGYGNLSQFEAFTGKKLFKIGKKVFSVREDAICSECDGFGCRFCLWIGFIVESHKEVGKLGIL